MRDKSSHTTGTYHGEHDVTVPDAGEFCVSFSVPYEVDYEPTTWDSPGGYSFNLGAPVLGDSVHDYENDNVFSIAGGGCTKSFEAELLAAVKVSIKDLDAGDLLPEGHDEHGDDREDD